MYYKTFVAVCRCKFFFFFFLVMFKLIKKKIIEEIWLYPGRICKFLTKRHVVLITELVAVCWKRHVKVHDFLRKNARNYLFYKSIVVYFKMKYRLWFTFFVVLKDTNILLRSHLHCRVIIRTTRRLHAMKNSYFYTWIRKSLFYYNAVLNDKCQSHSLYNSHQL